MRSPLIPVDSSALIALIDTQDANHAPCMAQLKTLPSPLVTTLPCITETLYLLGKVRGWQGQNALWQYRRDKRLLVYPLTDDDITRAASLMKQYRDLPCDFADASLIVLAEQLEADRIFTLDSHFYAYRVRGGALLVLP